MEEYFLRQYPLWGEETQKSLKSKRIAIIGCGGLGSTLGITLGSSGIGTLHLVDFDNVALHNIHRQIAYRMEDMGKPKAKVLASLIRSRYFGIEVTPHIQTFEEFAKSTPQVDIILDATDNLKSRALIAQAAKEWGIPWVYASVEEWHGHVCLFIKGDFAKAIVINDRKPAGIAPPIVSFIAALEANITLRYLTGLPVEADRLHYLYFDADGQLQLKKLVMPN